MITMGSPDFVWINANAIISSWYLLGAVCVAPPTRGYTRSLVEDEPCRPPPGAAAHSSSSQLQSGRPPRTCGARPAAHTAAKASHAQGGSHPGDSKRKIRGANAQCAPGCSPRRFGRSLTGTLSLHRGRVVPRRVVRPRVHVPRAAESTQPEQCSVWTL
jgi:hypothetical protein